MSILKVNTLQEATSGGATYFTARAWVNFNGTGTVAIRDDGNVSSITDLATGKFRINYSTDFNDINYAATSNIRADTDYAPTSGQPHEYSTQSTSQINIKTGSFAAAIDSTVISLIAVD